MKTPEAPLVDRSWCAGIRWYYQKTLKVVVAKKLPTVARHVVRNRVYFSKKDAGKRKPQNLVGGERGRPIKTGVQ